MRGLALVVAMFFVASVLSTSGATAEAKGKRSGVFGTATGSVVGDQLEVATRKGVLSLTITDKTKIDRKKNAIRLNEVTAGASVTGYYTKEGDDLVAGKLTFKQRKQTKILKHLIGVVIDKKKDKITVQTTDGDEVEIDTQDNPSDDPTEEGSLVVTVVETDTETGDTDAVAVRTAEQTIARLNDAIGHEITLAQEKLLKVRMSETASVHLTRLYETLDEIQAEAQQKIEAAFAEFQSNYTTTLDDHLIAPPLVEISGRVLSRNPDLVVIAANGNGRRSYVLVSPDVEVELLDGSPGAIADVAPDSWVELLALPQTKISSPIAQFVKVIPTPQSPGNSGNSNGNGNGNSNGNSQEDETITGTIVVVDNGNSGTQRVIVVDNPDGSEEAAGVTDDTEITGDDDLVPGQEVEVTLEDDGFSAEEVVVVSSPTDPATPVPTITPPTEYKLTGKIRELSVSGVVLDNVYLTLDTTTSPDEPLEVGQEIQFTVIVDDQGRWMVVGIDE